MFCQSVMYFHTPANSLKFTPPLFSRSNMAAKGGRDGKDEKQRQQMTFQHTSAFSYSRYPAGWKLESGLGADAVGRDAHINKVDLVQRLHFKTKKNKTEMYINCCVCHRLTSTSTSTLLSLLHKSFYLLNINKVESIICNYCIVYYL